MFRREEQHWWEQLRHMLAQLCSILVNTAEGAAGDGKHYVFTGPNHKQATPLDFIPKRWLGGETDTRAPIKREVVRAVNGRHIHLLQGMSGSDANSFLTELGVGA